MFSYKILNGGTTTKCSRIPWQTSVMCFYVILALMKIASCEAMPSIKEFFPSIKNDLTKVIWTNDVYNDESFQEALNGKIMMINSDIRMKTLGKGGLGKKPIRAPLMFYRFKYIYGMSLKQLLEKVADAKSFGVKLNFEEIAAFKESIKVLKSMSGKMKFPLWLHAYTYDMDEKDIDKFLSLCTHNFPEATISIGMEYKNQSLGYKKMYPAELVTQMKNTLTRNNVTQTVAFPVFMPPAAFSLETLPALKDVHGITDSALYIFVQFFENFNDDEFYGVRKLVKIFGKDRVYLDMTEKVRKRLI